MIIFKSLVTALVLSSLLSITHASAMNNPTQEDDEFYGKRPRFNVQQKEADQEAELPTKVAVRVLTEPVRVGIDGDSSNDFASKAEPPKVDLEALYHWTHVQGQLSAVPNAELIDLPKGSHSVNILGVKSPDVHRLLYVFKQLYLNFRMNETNALLEVMNNPLFLKWNSKENLSGNITLKVNIPLNIYEITDIVPPQVVVVLTGAAGVALNKIKDQKIICGFAQRLAELHHYTRRCHRDLIFSNIIYDVSKDTIELIDVAGFAQPLPEGRELDYMLGSIPSHSILENYVEGDVRRICTQLSGSKPYSVMENDFKQSYVKALMMLDLKTGIEARKRFGEMWEFSVGETLRFYGNAGKNPFDSLTNLN